MEIEKLNKEIESSTGLVLYFSTTQCNVCKTLRPKVKTMITEHFPKMNFLYIDCDIYKETAAQMSIFAVPTIVVYFTGREHIRKSRFVGMQEIIDAIDRPYSMCFSEE